MNILQIAHKGIFPPDGGNVALLNLAKAYTALGHNVHLLNMITGKHYNHVESIHNINITGVKVNTNLSYFKIITNYFFSKKAYIASRFYSKNFLAAITKEIRKNNYDIIQLESLYCLQYVNDIRKIFHGKIVYRSHNIEHQIWDRIAEETSFFLKKIYYKSISKRLEQLEKSLLNNYDYILPISQVDANTYEKLGNKKPMLVTNFGIESKNIEHKTNNQYIKYLGALDWIPNQNGLLWFTEKCFPIVLSKFPDTKLIVAGRNAPGWLINKLQHSAINYLGEIKDATELFSKKGPFIVPLFSGSGMRVKIIEAMSYGNAVVSTQTGAEGINYTDSENIIIANTETEFANNIIHLLSDKDLQNSIGKNALDFVSENYDYINIGRKVLNFIQ